MDDEATQTMRRTDSGYRIELNQLRIACAQAQVALGSAGSMDDYNFAINGFIAAVNALEDHLHPYLDRAYKAEREKHDKLVYPNFDDVKKENPNEEDPDVIERKVEQGRLEALRLQQRKIFRSLQDLQDRMNVLLEGATEDYAGD